MKYPFIRRAAAMALALVFALTLLPSLVAPARAAEPELDSDHAIAIEASKTVKAGAEAQLEVTWTSAEPTPKEDTNISYHWSITGGGVTFKGGEAGNTNTVTVVAGAAAGEATVSVYASWTESGDTDTEKKTETVQCKLTVTTDDSGSTGSGSDDNGGGEKEPVTPGIMFEDTDTIQHDQTRWPLEVFLLGDGVNQETTEITWTVRRQLNEPETTKLPQLEGTDASGERVTGSTITAVGPTVTVVDQGAGKFYITASFTKDGRTYTTPEKNLTVSGISLSWSDEETVMTIGQSGTITCTPYGDADDLNVTKVVWSSSDSAVASVMNNGGNVNAWAKGRAIITATKGKYTASCTVVVVEDTSAIADKLNNGRTPISASVSNPLTFDTFYETLESICEVKTRPAGGEEGSGSDLRYITNLKVTFTDQGTLYYNYSTESDTGDGVGSNDQFALSAGGSVKAVKRLYFVPKQGFSGQAEISFTGVSTEGQNFTGIIRVNVNVNSDGTSSGTYQISYRAQAGEPVWFMTDDFAAYCRSEYGRSFNYIIFNLPKSSEGTLYYNYMAGSGNQVTTSLKFTQTGQYTVDDVCFVPNAAYSGVVYISFRGMDTSGAAIDGTVEVNVTSASDDSDPSTVTVSGERGRPTALQSELFNAASRATINDTLSFVTFKLPDPDVGTLYINYQSDEVYESRVTAGTRCYYSGTPGLNSVSFVPASNASGRIAISYTGHGAGGASYSGTLYIDLGEVNRSVIRYSVPRGGSVSFSASDFNAAGQQTVGSGVSFVKFTVTSDEDNELGTLRWRNTSTNTPAVYISDDDYIGNSYIYYVSPTGTSQRGLSRVFFDAAKAVGEGTVTISYTAYSGTVSRPVELFKGSVVIQVGNLSPEDIKLSCKTGGYAELYALTVDTVCGEVMGGSLSYIEITSVPDAAVGHLYFNYDPKVYGTGTVVKPGERFNRSGSSGISQLTFVPHARFTGDAEITYIAYSGSGEQVSGRIVVSVTASTTSYFTDMGSYAWAIDSVEYLRRNGTVNGVGGTSFNPGGGVKRGDFVLMLVRAYGFTASGSAYFSDVPASKYYADAIRIAYQRGIISGSNGYFYPEDALTRQDAMVMIYNALRASGKAPTNGLAADLSVYLDEEKIAPSAKEAMGILIQMGVVQGVGNGYLEPQRQIKRAEAAILLHTIMTL